MTEQAPMGRTRTAAAEVALVVLWSSGFIGALLASELPSTALPLMWRFIVLSLLLSPFLVRALRGHARAAIARQAAVGALAMFGYLAGVVTAIDLGLSAGMTALVAALQPLATAALAGTVLGERVTVRQWGGLAIGLGGVALAVGVSPQGVPQLGVAAALCGVGALVAGTLLAKADPAPMPLAPALAVQVTASVPLFSILAALAGPLAPQATADFWVAVLWWVFLSTFGGYLMYFLCLRLTGATRVASLIYLTPPVTALWAFAMFGQPIGWGAVAAFAVCLAGVVLAAPPSPRGPGVPRPAIAAARNPAATSCGSP